MLPEGEGVAAFGVGRGSRRASARSMALREHLFRRLGAGKTGDLVALLAGALLPFAFAPYHLYPLAILSPAILFASWMSLSPARAFWRGWLYGLGMFGVGVSWIFVSINRYGAASVPLALGLTFLFIAVMALYMALLGYVAVRCFRRVREAESLPPVVAPLVIFPALWVLFEWWRGWFLSGFPWLNLGTSQLQAPLDGLAPVAGVYGVSWAVALSAGLLVAVAWAPGRKRLWLSMFAMLWAGVWLLGKVEWTRPSGEPLEVVLLQGNVSQDIKWLPEQLQPNLELYTGLTAQHWGADLIVWPETAITAFYHQLKEGFIEPLHRVAREHGTDLLAGLPLLDEESGRYYNAVMSIGRQEAFYRKHHLVPFGDFVPFEEHLRGLIAFFDLPMSSFSAGPPRQPPLKVAGRLVGISICYEDAFGAEVIRVLPDAELLVNVSNDAWWGDSFGPHQHLQIAAMRAREGGRPLLRSTNTGITALVDHRGRIVAVAPQFRVAALEGEVQPRQGATPYVRWGNTPVILLMAGLVAGVIFYAGFRRVWDNPRRRQATKKTER